MERSLKLIFLCVIWLSAQAADGAPKCQKALTGTHSDSRVQLHYHSRLIDPKEVPEPNNEKIAADATYSPRESTLKWFFLNRPTDVEAVFWASKEHGTPLSIEMHPVEIYQHTKIKSMSDDGAVQLGHPAYRLMTIKTTKIDLFIREEIDTEVIYGDLPGPVTAKWKRNMCQTCLKSALEVGLSKEEEIQDKQNLFQDMEHLMLQEGVKRQKEIFKKTWEPVNRDYKDRRNFNRTMRKHSWRDLYRARNMTRIVNYYLPSSNGNKGQHVATIAFTRSTYGAVEFFNKATGKRELRYGPFGSAFLSNHYVSDFSPFSKVPPVKNWHGPIELIPPEVFYQPLGDFTLPRPLVPDMRRFQTRAEAVAYMQDFLSKQEYDKSKIDPDYNQEINFYTGQIWADHKFWVMKSERRPLYYRKLLEEFPRATFMPNMSVDFNFNGQAHFVIGGPLEKKAYYSLGYRHLKSIALPDYHGQGQYFVVATPYDRLEAVKAQTEISDEAIIDLVKRLQKAN